MLDLHKDIFLQSSTGYEARLTQAFVDMGKGTVTSDEHVDVKLLNGTLTADRLRITGGGEVVQVRRQCRDEFDHGQPVARRRVGRRQRQRSALRTLPPPARRDPLRQVRQPEMILMMKFFRAALLVGGSRTAPAWLHSRSR